jgi:hypothetical protein
LGLERFFFSYDCSFQIDLTLKEHLQSGD